MSASGEWLRRIWYLLNRGRLEAALREEMDAHRAMMGEPTRFGNTLQLREQSGDVWGWAPLDALVRDVRFAARGLRRTPVFTLVAIVSLALGLALTTTTVSVVNAYLIRSLPYPNSDRLYHVMYAPPGPWEPRGMTGLDWTSVEDVVEFPIAASGESFYLSGGGHSLAARPPGDARIRGRPRRVRGRRAAIHRGGLRRRIRAGRAHRTLTVARSVRIGS